MRYHDTIKKQPTVVFLKASQPSVEFVSGQVVDYRTDHIYNQDRPKHARQIIPKGTKANRHAITVSFVIAPPCAYTANAFTSRIYFSTVVLLLSSKIRCFLNMLIAFAVTVLPFIPIYLRAFFTILPEKYEKRNCRPGRRLICSGTQLRR